jgi:carbon-monoxide dehydrogenase medium subunit
MVGLAAQALVAGDRFADLKLGYFAVGATPVLAKAAGKLTGVAITPVLLAEALDALSDELDPHEDQQASPAMRRHLAKVLLARCIASLLNRSDLHAGASA